MNNLMKCLKLILAFVVLGGVIVFSVDDNFIELLLQQMRGGQPFQSLGWWGFWKQTVGQSDKRKPTSDYLQDYWNVEKGGGSEAIYLFIFIY